MNHGIETMSRSRKVWQFIARCFALLIAGILFWSGAEHLKNPYAFLTSVLRYRLVSGQTAMVVAMALPVAQTVIAGMIFLGIGRSHAMLWAAALLTLFTGVQMSALVRGLEIGCGCFGIANETPISWLSMSRVAILAALGWCVVATRQPSVRSGGSETGVPASGLVGGD